MRMFESAGHLSAGLGATAARLRAALAVFHLVCIALPRTPITNVGAERAELFRKRAVARNCIAAESRNGGAFDAARRTVIGTGFSGHVREAMATFCRTVIARGNALLRGLIEMFGHDVAPLGHSGIGAEPAQAVDFRSVQPVSLIGSGDVIQIFASKDAARNHP